MSQVMMSAFLKRTLGVNQMVSNGNEGYRALGPSDPYAPITYPFDVCPPASANNIPPSLPVAVLFVCLTGATIGTSYQHVRPQSLSAHRVTVAEVCAL